MSNYFLRFCFFLWICLPQISKLQNKQISQFSEGKLPKLIVDHKNLFAFKDFVIHEIFINNSMKTSLGVLYKIFENFRELPVYFYVQWMNN